MLLLNGWIEIPDNEYNGTIKEMNERNHNDADEISIAECEGSNVYDGDWISKQLNINK